MTGRFAQLAQSLEGRYRLQRELGAGGMATVFLAHDLKHDRDVAIKVLHADLGERVGIERFEAEIRTTARLRHPHILPLFDSGEANGALYYVMPLVDGTTLRDRLESAGALPVSTALRITQQVAEALAHAHVNGIVHRDVKPENILLENGNALVVDFGIARMMDRLEDPRLTQTGRAIGTPVYMSPEQAVGDEVIDGRSDTYSLACVLFEMLTGRAPFVGATPEALVAQRFTRAAPRVRSFRADVPGFVDVAIHQALSLTVADRPATIERFAQMLREGTEESTVVGDLSIAVLPFENMSGGAEAEYFSDGISEDIINVLTRLDGLRVVARTSSFAFRHSGEDLRTIGEKLRVSMVLEGSVRRASNRLRITARLVTVSDGCQLWSERFDRELTDVFVVQDEIANAIAAQLQVTFSGAMSHRPTLSTSVQVEAYEFYLKARALLTKRGIGVQEALRYLQQSVSLDATSAPAWAALGEAYRQLAWFSYFRPRDVIPLAKEALGRALDLDPHQGEALGTLAYITLCVDRNTETAFELWERALTQHPRLAEVRCFWAGYGLCLLRGEDSRAVAEVDRAVADDPLNSVCASLRCAILALLGRQREAVAEAERAVALEPGAFLPRICQHYVHLFSGDVEAAHATAQSGLQSFGRHPQFLASMSGLHAARGDADLALAAHAEIIARARTEIVDPVFLTLSALGIGAIDEAMDHALRAVDENVPLQIWLIRRPGTDALHAHPMYPELRRRMGW